jgi:CheY-like chemotaxis protein
MSQRPCILIAEDDLGPREALRFLLKDDYRLIFAEDGREALARVHQDTPDLILMDIRMPYLDGWEAIRQLRNEGISAPIIVITGFPDPADKEKIKELSVKAYLSKPFDLLRLQELIRSTLEGVN